MRYAVVALAALVLLFTAAWVSWGGNDVPGVARLGETPGLATGSRGLLVGARPCSRVVVDADVTRLIAYGDYWRGMPDIRVAGTGEVATLRLREVGIRDVEANAEEAVDENPYLEAATKFYGVEEFRDALIIVRFRESSNIVEPCKVGNQGELGPFQFMDDTWAGTPYAHLDPCDLEAATWAAAWFVKEGRWLEWSTWPR